MAIRKVLTDKMLRALKAPTEGRIEVFDAIISPLMMRITPTGHRSFALYVRVRKGPPVRLALGDYGAVTLEAARRKARTWLELIAQGHDPREHEAREAERRRREEERAHAENFAAICETFLARHAAKNRSGSETRRIFEKYVLPSWGARPIESITRRNVAELLDLIEDGKLKGPKGEMLGGPVMADHVLAQIRKLFNWHASRSDTFVSPVVRGMARTNGRDRARTRVLSDDEIRRLWPLLDRLGTFGALTKTLFLTAQRRDEVARMRRAEIDADGVWTIPAERHKTGKPNLVPLSKAALAVIEAQPVIGDSDLVFTSNGRSAFCGFSKARRNLDKMLPEPLPPWVLHDVRRTAKSLMARAGVLPHISECVLGHVIPGVEGIYDRHTYTAEKKLALEKLAREIERIVNPPAADAAKVVALRPIAG